MKNICIDIGNTQTKIGIFENSDLLETTIWDVLDVKNMETIILENQIEFSIVSNVNESQDQLLQMLQTKTKHIPFNYFTKLPFTNNYKTPNTLGLDRIALSAAAVDFINESNVLVISLGTCVTFEFLNRKKEYLGGAISPGLNMRLQAMNYFTAKLPLLTFTEPIDFNGNSTESCMQSGAFYGLLEEIKGRINLYETQFGETQIILCGGNCFLFEKHLKKALFAHPYLTLFGLNKILKHNV
ncbi:MAG: type III pantothenate kinase [Bacteroidia bacterium]